MNPQNISMKHTNICCEMMHSMNLVSTYLSLECPKHFKRTFLKMGLSRPLFLLFSSFQYKAVDNK